jgi:DNA-binding MarR family transcriptional regulator
MSKVVRNDAPHTAERLHSIAIHLLRRLRRSDVQMGLSGPRASALSVLVFGGPASLAQLAAAEQVKPPTMTRIVTGLEDAGLVKRETDTEDQRAIRITATARGKKLLLDGRARRLEDLVDLLGGLNAEERTALLTTVTALERVLGRARN